ncbi:MAG: hypothetical protein Q7T91_08380 [Sulfuricurvum sp.]|nr:hypothetical protein [Sulfuricurvum sp.]
MIEFVKMPSHWITDKANPGLKQLAWGKEDNAGKIAALMLYIAIAHHANKEPNREYQEPGFAKLSYSDFEEILGLSRAKISCGLINLKELGIIKIDKGNKTSVYQLDGYDPSKGWAKLPYQHLYQGKQIKVFTGFHLRQRTELHALKMYLLVAAFRDNVNNHTFISFEKITDYTGIPKNEIRSAISVLINHRLIQVERDQEANNALRSKNIYRLLGLKGRHSGTISQDELNQSAKDTDFDSFF